VEDGTPFGRYRLLDLLGRGGMGEVWRAFDTATERVVALKVLPTQFADDATFQERFRREAKAAAALDEPHVVPIHDFGEIDGRLYVTMRLIKGHDLHTILGQGRMDVPRAVAIVDQVASALHAAHQVNLVHRDVKPSNILVGDNDFAYLIDFGIARAAGQTGLTSTSSVIGTWAYMAPERMTTSQTDARSDIYALACVLYECLTGNQPFPGDSLEQQIGGHIAMPPPRASDRYRDVPPQLDDVIAKGMAKNPDDRFATTRELAFAARSAVTAPITLPPAVLPTTPTPFRNPYPNPPHNQPPRPPIQPAYVTRRAEFPPTGPNSSWPGQPPPSWPGQPAPNPLPPKSSRNRMVAIASVAVVAIVAIVAAFILVNSGDKGGPGPNAGPARAQPTNGPLTGAFNVAFGQVVLSDGTQGVGNPFTETWRMRSECGDNGCIATAIAGGGYTSLNVVFDKVADGSWVSVSTSSVQCKGFSDEAWDTISLQPQSDGSMTGEWTQSTQHACWSKRTATFTRTGDTDTAALPDPSTQPKRIVSPAEMLHGQYDSNVTYPTGDPRVVTDHLGVKTFCLRTGDRCMSYFMNPDAFQPFIFANGQWTADVEYDHTCSGENSHVKWTSTLPLPPSPSDPITNLSGHGYAQSIGGKCASLSFEQTMTRTGN
jgi:serine/threonine-protein kinase